MGFFQLAVVLVALGQSGTLTAKPAQLVAASDAQVELQLAVDPPPPPGAAVRFDTFGVGAVSAAREDKPGLYKAMLTPPRERYPQVVIVRAFVAGRNVWGAVPVLGVQTVKITTKPNAMVDVVVGPLHFPSDKPADAAGRIDVAIKVPPGVDVARVRSTDRLGNKTDKPLPLDPPEFVRVRAAPVGREAAASWADEKPLPLEFFAIQRDGNTLAAGAVLVAELENKAEGTLEAPTPRRPGLWSSLFRAPRELGDGKALIVARLRERGAPLSKPGTLEVQLRGGPPVSIAIASEKPVLRPDDPSTKLTASAADAEGNVVGAAQEVTCDFGKMEREADGFILTIPQELGGRQTVTVTARAGAATQTLQLPLKAGLPSSGAIVFADTKVRAGDAPLKGTVTLKDARGNPVMGAELKFAANRGRAELVREVGGGLYEVQFLADNASAAGVDTLEVSVADAPVKLSAPLIILPGIKPGSTSVGLFAGGRSNFGVLRGGGATLEAAVHPSRLPLELLGAITWVSFAPATVEVFPGVNLEGRFQTLQLGVGGRYSLPLAAHTSLYGSLAGGGQRVSQNVTLPVANLSADPTAWSATARAALGVTQRLGPGRVAVELGYGFERFLWRPSDDRAAVSANPAIANLPPVTGNLGGVQLSVGYLFQVR